MCIIQYCTSIANVQTHYSHFGNPKTLKITISNQSSQDSRIAYCYQTNQPIITHHSPVIHKSFTHHQPITNLPSTYHQPIIHPSTSHQPINLPSFQASLDHPGRANQLRCWPTPRSPQRCPGSTHTRRRCHCLGHLPWWCCFVQMGGWIIWGFLSGWGYP